MEPVITAEGLGKRYTLGESSGLRYHTLRDTLGEYLGSLFPAPGTTKGSKTEKDAMWALRNLDVRIGQGELVGIIGPNGAGKTTLLKILSRITEPTEGHADVRGRVGALLEVGTGFHPELTGRENIFLNGAILGMHRAEIRRKLDEIIAFAEVGPFVDTPVKRYSSGMQTRLAFAVAAHFESDIMLVDEVLAVGDAKFRKKCLGKVRNVSETGRTVLFVSHDMSNIHALCKRTLWLDKGTIRKDGPTQEIVTAYMRDANTSSNACLRWDREDAPGTDHGRILMLQVGRADSASVSIARTEEVSIQLRFEVSLKKTRLNPVLQVSNPQGTVVFTTSNYGLKKWGDRLYDPGMYAACCTVPSHIFNQGDYLVTAMLIRDMRYSEALTPEGVWLSIYDNANDTGDYVGPWHGVVRPACRWAIDKVD